MALAGVTVIALGAVLAAMSELGPFATAFWRMLIGAPICFAVLTLWRGRTQLTEVASILRRREAWLTGLALTSALLLWYSSQRLSSVASTSTLHNLTPVIVLSFMWIAFGHRPMRRTVKGILLGLVGAIMLAWHSGGTADQGLIGDALATASAVCMATYYILVARLIRKIPTMAIMGVLALIALPIMLPFALLIDRDMIPTSLSGWLGLLGVALCGQVIGQALVVTAARWLGAAGISVVTLAEPALATLFAVLLMAAPIAGWQLAAIATTMLGIYLCQHQYLSRRAFG